MEVFITGDSYQGSFIDKTSLRMFQWLVAFIGRPIHDEYFLISLEEQWFTTREGEQVGEGREESENERENGRGCFSTS